MKDHRLYTFDHNGALHVDVKRLINSDAFRKQVDAAAGSRTAADGQARGDFSISVLANMADEFAGFDLDSYQRKLLNQARAICANPPLPYHAKLSSTSGGDWVLVPREPTKEMLKAVANGDPVCGWAVKDIYSAMLAAALSARKAGW